MGNFPAREESFILLHEVGSTNNYAMACINEGPVNEGTIYFARKQTAGKGQRGKKWDSMADENITMSLVLKPRHLQISEQFLLSAIAALGNYDFVKKYAGGGETKIKWSNDLYWNDKKAGGMLIENVIRGKNWHYAVIGLGVNINQEGFPTELPNPVSLRQITGMHYDVVSMAKELGECISRRYATLKPENFNRILEEYNSVLYLKDVAARYRIKNHEIIGTIQGVEQSGKLLLKTADTLLKADFGELTFVL